MKLRPDSERLMRVSEVAAYGVSEKTVRRWISVGLLPAMRVGRVLRVLGADFAAFVDKHRVVARPRP